jgi:spore germination protein GerM
MMLCRPEIRRRCLAVTAALAVILVASGCGVPTQSSPKALPSSELPLALAASAPPSTIPPIPPTNGHGAVEVHVYFLYKNNTELRQVPTAVREPPGDTPEAVLRALEDGPSSKLYAEGYTTALPANANFQVIGPPVHGILPVALDSTYYRLPGQVASLELAQVVYTLLSAPGDVKEIQFYRNGAKAGVLGGNDQYIPGAVSRSDYASLFSSTD